MPMLADLVDPPRSRTRDLLLGVLVGLPIVGVIAWFLLPGLAGMILGNANNYDQRLRSEDAYMQALCTEAMDLERDEDLCKCVLAVEFPALDCRQPFLRWSLTRHKSSCEDPEVHRRALTFCTCIETVAARADQAADADAARVEVQRTGKCLELGDAFPLPELATLAASN